MGIWGWVLHLGHFVWPAVVVAGGLALGVVGCNRSLWTGRGLRRWCRVWAVLAAVGVAVLLGGLVFFGRDGKMATYAWLVLTQGGMAGWLGRPVPTRTHRV